jgi:hypothetical protein
MFWDRQGYEPVSGLETYTSMQFLRNEVGVFAPVPTPRPVTVMSKHLDLRADS